MDAGWMVRYVVVTIAIALIAAAGFVWLVGRNAWPGADLVSIASQPLVVPARKATLHCDDAPRAQDEADVG